MAERECLFEEIAKESKVPFVFRRKYMGEIFGSNNILILNVPYFQMVSGDISEITKDFLEQFCSRCSLCIPGIEQMDRETFSIRRFNYGAYEKNVPLAEITVLKAEGESKQTTIALVDDEESMLPAFGGLLKEDGYDVICVAVNGRVRVGAAETQALSNSILERRPDWIIADVGLGYFDGVEILKYCKGERDVRTILLTGQGRMDELIRTKAADYFLGKPVGYKRVLEILETH